MFRTWLSRIMSVIMLITSFFGINLGSRTAPTDMITYNRRKTEVTIALESNPSTGYDWVYGVSDLTVVKNTNDRFYDGNSGGMAGAPGTRAVTFKGLKAGTATVTFHYQRSWEEEEPIRTVVIKIAVAENKKLTAEEIANSQDPADVSDTLSIFNDASAKVVSAKPGFTKKTNTTIPKLEMGALAKIKVVRGTIGDFLGEGSSSVTVAKGKSNSANYLKSSLTAADVTNATAKLSADGKTYDITLTVKNETNPLKGKSALGRFTNDYKDAQEIRSGLEDAGAKVEKITMKSTSVVIKATIDAATGEFKSLNYNIKQDAIMEKVTYVVTVSKATGTVVNDVSFSNFKY